MKIFKTKKPASMIFGAGFFVFNDSFYTNNLTGFSNKSFKV
jgi:hypothetical protein